jgi:hypothetical protein
MFKAGLVHEKLGDSGGQLKLWKAFLKRYAKQPGVDTKIVEATLRMADLYTEAGNRKVALKFYAKTIEEYEKRGLQPATAAADFAAKAEFALIEARFQRYKRLNLKGSLARQGKTIKTALKMKSELKNSYSILPKYKANDWVIAALYRIARLNELYAKLFYGAPDPTGVTDSEMDEYRTMIEDEGLKFENAAIRDYETAIKQARRDKLVNEWTLKLRTTLNRFKPSEYPLFKEEKRSYSEGVDFNVPLQAPADKKPPQPATSTGTESGTATGTDADSNQPVPPLPETQPLPEKDLPEEPSADDIPPAADEIPVPTTEEGS